MAKENEPAPDLVGELREALEAVALSPQWNCTGEHKGGCDCVGDKVRAALARAKEHRS